MKNFSMSVHKLEYAKCIKKHFGNIDKQYHSAIKATLEDLATDPIKKSSKVKNPNLPARKVRSGDYRILFDLDMENKIIQVKVIKHRSDVYE